MMYNVRDSSMTLLYADDDRDDCDLMCEALQNVDPAIICHVVNNGQQALDTLQDQQNDLPDYIFLDINMPRMDGKKCLEAIKSDQRFKDIPVIMYSTTTDQKEIDECYALGATSFIKKPNNFKELYSVMHLFVKLAQLEE
jgi:CheY-like chemotaxis protein